MKELDRIIALCRRDPEVASLSLLLSACLWGIVAILFGMVPADADLSPLGHAMTGHAFSPPEIDSDQIGHLLVAIAHAYFTVCAILMGISGIGVEGARRLGILRGHI